MDFDPLVDSGVSTGLLTQVDVPIGVFSLVDAGDTTVATERSSFRVVSSVFDIM